MVRWSNVTRAAAIVGLGLALGAGCAEETTSATSDGAETTLDGESEDVGAQQDVVDTAEPNDTSGGPEDATPNPEDVEAPPEDVPASDVADASTDLGDEDGQEPQDVGEASDADEDATPPSDDVESDAVPDDPPPDEEPTLEECLEEACPDELEACDAVAGCIGVIFCMDICDKENVPHCGDGTCDADEDSDSCVEDCPLPFCGDFECNGDEDDVTCPGDCYEPVCGDGECYEYEQYYCDEDCASECGNGTCEDWDENFLDCPVDCPVPDCGDDVCEEDSGENWTNCALDCPEPICGDGECNGDEDNETCSEDCEEWEGGGGGGFFGGGGGGFFGGGGGGFFGGDGEEDPEEQLKELYACYESCMMSATIPEPIPEWGSLETCADEMGCIDMDAITAPAEGGEGQGSSMGSGVPQCGNGVCQFASGENAEECPEDCEGVEPPECYEWLPCTPPAWCESGTCVCPADYLCDDVCVDIQSSELHCGDCGNACPQGATCSEGGCACPEETLPCGDVCADLNSDPNHCGACFEACVAAAQCVAGLCVGTPPRHVGPMSGSITSSSRPLFEVELPEGADAALISICADRLCQTTVTSFSISMGSGAPQEDLPQGALFWRAQTKALGQVAPETSATWPLYIRDAGAEVASAWGISTDINMDGMSDVVVGSCGAEGCSSSFYVHYSSPDGISKLPDDEFSQAAGATGQFATTVMGAGDTNGDGFSELLVVTGDTGVLARYENGPQGLSPGAKDTWSIPGASITAAGVGDVDRDGFGELVWAATDASGFSLAYGGAGGPGEPILIDLPDWLEGDIEGLRLSHGGDVNGDGRSDVLALIPSASTALIYFGTPIGLAPQPGGVYQGPATFAASMANVGDVNGDGYTDVVVGEPQLTDGGSGHLYLGGPFGTDSDPDVTHTALDIEDLGRQVQGIGDVNGDGLSDVALIGTLGVRVLLGDKEAPLSGTPIDIFTPTALTGPSFADAVSGVRDLNGDGRSDLLIGAPSLGKVYLYAGAEGGPDPSAPTLTLEGLEAIPGFGSSLAWLNIHGDRP